MNTPEKERTVIGIIGSTASGKTKLADIIAEYYGLKVYELSSEIQRIADREGFQIVARSDYSKFASIIRERYGNGYFVNEILKRTTGDIIISGIRNPVTTLQLLIHYRLYILGIDAELPVRYERFKNRKRSEDKDMTFDEFVVLQEQESANIEQCLELLNGHFVNNGTEQELRRDIDLFLSYEPPFSLSGD